MKTALDWMTDPQCGKRATEQDVLEWIQAIQLDAFKHGMRIAAGYVSRRTESDEILTNAERVKQL